MRWFRYNPRKTALPVDLLDLRGEQPGAAVWPFVALLPLMPLAAHQHWHIDVLYINISGTFF
jgi:hypothetical protein